MKIKICIVGIGNCASTLIQGIYFYKNEKTGLIHYEIEGYKPNEK